MRVKKSAVIKKISTLSEEDASDISKMFSQMTGMENAEI
jgi:hypothetical protein